MTRVERSSLSHIKFRIDLARGEGTAGEGGERGGGGGDERRGRKGSIIAYVRTRNVQRGEREKEDKRMAHRPSVGKLD